MRAVGALGWGVVLIASGGCFGLGGGDAVVWCRVTQHGWVQCGGVGMLGAWERGADWNTGSLQGRF